MGLLKKHSDILDMTLNLAADLHSVGAIDKAALVKMEELASSDPHSCIVADARAHLAHYTKNGSM